MDVYTRVYKSSTQLLICVMENSRGCIYLWMKRKIVVRLLVLETISAVQYPRVPSLSLYLILFLAHWGQVTHICVNKLTVIVSDNLNQCWNIVNWNLGKKLQWNLNRNSSIFNQENAIWKCRLENGGHFVSGSMCLCYSYSSIHATVPMCFQTE